jgi:Transcriptional regulatory protein, C terminal
MAGAPRYLFGDCELNAGTCQLLKGAEPQPLEPKALDVLRLLLDRAPHVVDKSEIFSIVWKDVAVTDNALTRIVVQLRKALDDDARDPRYIATISTRAGLGPSADRAADSKRWMVLRCVPVQPIRVGQRRHLVDRRGQLGEQLHRR